MLRKRGKKINARCAKTFPESSRHLFNDEEPIEPPVRFTRKLSQLFIIFVSVSPARVHHISNVDTLFPNRQTKCRNLFTLKIWKLFLTCCSVSTDFTTLRHAHLVYIYHGSCEFIYICAIWVHQGDFCLQPLRLLHAITLIRKKGSRVVFNSKR